MFKKVTALLLALAFTLSFAACGGSKAPAETKEDAAAPAEEKTDDAAPAEEKSDDAAPAEAKEGISIVHVVAGNLGDVGLSDMVQAALEDYTSEFGGTVNAIELAYDASLNESTMLEVCKSGEYDLVVSGFYNLAEAIAVAATEYPDQKFIAFDIEMDYSDGKFQNVKSIQAKQNEGSFLAGALAALLTTREDVEGINADKKVSFIGGMENTAILDFLTGYVDGVKYVDPSVEVLFSFIGDFSDTAKAKELTLAQYQQGSDVAYAVCSTASIGVAEAGKENQNLVIGVDWDLAESLKANSPDTAKWVVSSCLKDLRRLVYDLMVEYQNGTIEWGTHTMAGVKEGGMRMADNEFYQALVPQDVQDEMATIIQDMSDGKIEVGTAIGADQATIDAMKAKAASTN